MRYRVSVVLAVTMTTWLPGRASSQIRVLREPGILGESGIRVLGELVCKGPGWAPLVHGLVALKASPRINDITSGNGGFSFHVPAEHADTLRDRYIELEVYAQSVSSVRKLIRESDYRRYRTTSEIWLTDLQVDRPCNQIQVADRGVLVEEQSRLRLLPDVIATPGYIRRVADRARRVSMALFPLVTVASPIQLARVDTFRLAGGRQAFGRTGGLTMRSASFLSAIPGNVSTPSRLAAGTMFLNPAAIPAASSVDVWVTSGNWGFYQAGAVLPLPGNVSAGLGLEGLHQQEIRTLRLPSGSEIPAELSVVQSSTTGFATWTPHPAASFAVSVKEEKAGTEQLTQLSTLKGLRFNTGAISGTPQLEARKSRGRVTDGAFGAVLYPHPALGVGLSVLNVLGAENPDTLLQDNSRAVLAGTKLDLGAVHVGVDVLAGEDRPTTSLGGSARLPNNLVLFGGFVTVHDQWTAGIGQDRVFVALQQSRTLGRQMTFYLKSSGRLPADAYSRPR